MTHCDIGNVCICKRVPKEKMIEAMESGAKTVSMIKYKTGAGSGACHGRRCTPKIERLLEAYFDESGNNSAGNCQ